MTQLRSLTAVLLFWLMPFAWAQNFTPVPPLNSHVTDTVGMLNPSQQQALENVLRDYAARTGSQIAVLIVSKTEPEAIEQYSIRVADQWKIGRKGIDDGVILVVAKDNPPALRRLRIEAGLGVQGVLTDVQSKRILQDVIAPHFRQNDFYGGLVAGVSAITSLLSKEDLPAAEGNTAQSGARADAGSGIGGLFPFLFFLFFIFMMRVKNRAVRRNLNRNHWGRSSGVFIAPGIGIGMGGFGGMGGGSGGGLFGGGGGFNGGGASGNW